MSFVCLPPAASLQGRSSVLFQGGKRVVRVPGYHIRVLSGGIPLAWRSMAMFDVKLENYTQISVFGMSR